MMTPHRELPGKQAKVKRVPKTQAASNLKRGNLDPRSEVSLQFAGWLVSGEHHDSGNSTVNSKNPIGCMNVAVAKSRAGVFSNETS